MIAAFFPDPFPGATVNRVSVIRGGIIRRIAVDSGVTVDVFVNGVKAVLGTITKPGDEVSMRVRHVAKESDTDERGALVKVEIQCA